MTTNREEKTKGPDLITDGVTHDLNNILPEIAAYPELLLLKLQSNSELWEPLEAKQGCAGNIIAHGIIPQLHFDIAQPGNE